MAADHSQKLTERDANFKTLRVLQERLAEAEATLALQSISAGKCGFRVVSRIFDGVPADYLGFFATAFAKSEKAIALLAAAEGGNLLFAQHPSAGKDMSALLKQVLERVGGKGGGTQDFARGRLIERSQAEKAVLLARELLPG